MNYQVFPISIIFKQYVHYPGIKLDVVGFCQQGLRITEDSNCFFIFFNKKSIISFLAGSENCRFPKERHFRAIIVSPLKIQACYIYLVCLKEAILRSTYSTICKRNEMTIHIYLFSNNRSFIENKTLVQTQVCCFPVKVLQCRAKVLRNTILLIWLRTSTWGFISNDMKAIRR